MSAHAPGAAWQQPALVDTFLSERQQLLPMLDVQEALIEHLFKRAGRPLRRFIDIGAGDGAMTRLLRSVQPAAEAVLVDYSEPMLARAQQRLGAAGGGWQTVRGDLRDPAWTAALPDGRPVFLCRALANFSKMMWRSCSLTPSPLSLTSTR